MTTERLTNQEAQALLVRKVVNDATIRADHFLRGMIPNRTDPPQVVADKKAYLLVRMRKWAADPILFMRENAWVPDPMNRFGSDAMPSGLSPKGMVPLVSVIKLEDVIRAIEEEFESGKVGAVIVDKPRQIAVTTAICWWLLHKFLFRKGFTAVIGSGKGPDEIDAGGKGKRDATSLFGRLRLFLDAFMWNLSSPNSDGTRTSLVKFNQHLAPLGGRYPAQKKALVEWRRNLTGMSDSDDTRMRLSRPKWIIHGTEMFPDAEGNWLLGDVPGDGFARSQTCSVVFIDEFPHCIVNLGPNTDKLAWASCAMNSRFRVAVGTWPRGLSHSTEMLKIIRSKPPNTRIIHVNWTDIPLYLFGAHWSCPCGHANEWHHTESPGHDGVRKVCGGCRREALVTKHMVSSPWFRDACGSLLNDRVSIASEILNDPEGTVEDRLFNPWRAETGVRRVELPTRDRLAMIEGFDPGTSALNPACWLLAAMDVKTLRLHIVGYWMAADSFIEWWVPFIKRWSPEQMRRMRPIYGRRSENPTWTQAFEYPPEAIEMMARVSAREDGAMRYPLGIIGGDKYGEHRHMMESPYERLRDYGIEVYEEYTSDRPALVKSGVEWSSRVTIDPDIADINPPGPLGPLPSLRQVFEGARAKAPTGQGEYKLDVDKKDPPNVSHAVDAFLYLTRLLDERVRSVATVTGDFEQEGGMGAAREPFRYAG